MTIFGLAKSLVAVLATALLAALATQATAEERRIADLWFAHNAVASMLGSGDEIKVTVCKPEIYPWLYHMTPGLAGATVVPSGQPNTETLLSEGIGLAFVSNSTPAEPLRAAGIETHQLSFNSLQTLLAALDQTADALATDVAQDRVVDYKTYLDDIQSKIAGRIAAVPDERRPRVLHLPSIEPLQADGAETIIDEWIRLSGGRNAADGLTGNLQTVSLEQVLEWQPDIVIVGANAQQPLPGPTGGWEGVTAVREGRVYRNPKGVFLWDRYSTEFALQLMWTSRLIYPELFADTDMRAEVREFYQRFFGYSASDEEVTRILDAQPPA
ncbi:ABC transporter substrate-binding protein [Tropicimonas sp.]|uniref:ABC transporter substrate-binding protein n=1 Tax=Tropicimonas sp. TaxID=2067044 RepID=UPI003A89986D